MCVCVCVCVCARAFGTHYSSRDRAFKQDRAHLGDDAVALAHGEVGDALRDACVEVKALGRGGEGGIGGELLPVVSGGQALTCGGRCYRRRQAAAGTCAHVPTDKAPTRVCVAAARPPDR